MARQFGVPGFNKNALAYADFRSALLPVHDAPRAPTTSDRKYAITTIWRNSVTLEMWILVEVANGLADWRQFISGSAGAVLDFLVQSNTAPGTLIVLPSATGRVTINGALVAAHSVPLETHSRALNTYNIEAQIANVVTPTPVNSDECGMACFNEDHFTRDAASGMISLKGGGLAIDQINVDAATLPGVDPVTADANGEITITGAQVAAGTVGTNVIRTHTVALNQFNIEVQRTTAVASSDADNNGVCHFYNNDFNVDANAFVTAAASNSVEKATNIGFSLSSGFLTVHTADGTSFSSSAVGRVRFQTPGSFSQNTLVDFVRPSRFGDSTATSDDIGTNQFGLSGGWATDIPLFLYGVINDNGTQGVFGVSRVPHLTVAPASGKIATSAAGTANTQASMFLLDEDIASTWTAPTISEYDGNPCVCLGAFRAQVTAAYAWTTSTLNGSDGIGNYHEETKFTMPNGTNGAASGKYFLDNGGTAPGVLNADYRYNVYKDGLFSGECNLSGDNGAAGGTAVTLIQTIPFVLTTIANTHVCGTGVVRLPASAFGVHVEAYNSLPQIDFRNDNDDVVLLNSNFSAGTRRVSWGFCHKIAII